MATAKLVSLERTPAEKKALEKEMTAPMPEAPDYPYGLELRIDDDTLDKLGLDDLPPTGTVVHFRAVATVTGARASADQSGDRSSIDMQITDMGITAISEPAKKRAKASVLYKSGVDPDNDGD